MTAMATMEEIYWCVRAWASQSRCGPDGKVLLEVAARRLSATIEHEPKHRIPYVTSPTLSHGHTSVCVYLLRESTPAQVRSFCRIACIGLHEGYARALRVMCLRLAADRGICVQGCGCPSSFRFAKPSTQTPLGAETLWMERSRQSDHEGESPIYPNWYDKALDNLCVCRKRLFIDSYVAALSFVVEHEWQHVVLGHCDTEPRGRPRIDLEREADLDSLKELVGSWGARGQLDALICGVVATFLVFHLKLVLDDLEGIEPERIGFYPSVRSRMEQFARTLLTAHTDTCPPLLAFNLLKTIVEVSSLHPAYASVLGTPWIVE
ncbi:MAG: hypothetical protein ACKO23_06665 [Gemmataceae bacterium]